jgi:hypothetical protein
MSARLFAALVLPCLSLLAAKRGNSKETLTSVFKKSTERKQTIKKFEIFYKEKYASWKKYFQPTGRRKSTGPRDSSRLNSKKS